MSKLNFAISKILAEFQLIIVPIIRILANIHKLDNNIIKSQVLYKVNNLNLFHESFAHRNKL